jgi:hypothetical protein
VEDAMKAPTVPVIDGGLRVQEAMEILRNVKHDEGVLVRGEPAGWSFLRWPDLEALSANGKQTETLDETGVGVRLPLLYPDYNLSTALGYAQSTPVVPVVHRANSKELLGIVRLQDVLQAFQNQAEADVEAGA